MDKNEPKNGETNQSSRSLTQPTSVTPVEHLPMLAGLKLPGVGLGEGGGTREGAKGRIGYFGL